MTLRAIGTRLKNLLPGRSSAASSVAMGAYLNEIASDALFELLRAQGYTALAVEPETADTPRARPLSCVIVEDDAVDRMRLRNLLAATGVDMAIHEFDTIAGARAHLAEKTADVILLDHLLPDGVGIDLAHELIVDSRLRGSGIAMITGAAIDGDEGDVPILSKTDLSADALTGVVEKARSSRTRNAAPLAPLPDQVRESFERLLSELEAGRAALGRGDDAAALESLRRAASEARALKPLLPLTEAA